MYMWMPEPTRRTIMAITVTERKKTKLRDDSILLQPVDLCGIPDDATQTALLPRPMSIDTHGHLFIDIPKQQTERKLGSQYGR